MNKTSERNWMPSATLETLKARAQLLKKVRQFFDRNNILEVETPLLCHAINCHPQIPMFVTHHMNMSGQQNIMFLQSSPESCMKRLLAAGSGSIYQICKAFRNESVDQLHNPEFTIVEWYLTGYDYLLLMDHVECFLKEIMGTNHCKRISYAEAFNVVGIDPHSYSTEQLYSVCTSLLDRASYNENMSHNELLDLIFDKCILPFIGTEIPLFVYDYPASQPCMAIITQDEPPVAQRFELFWQGIEIANGYSELLDSKEQRRRFENEVENIQIETRHPYPIDEQLLSALRYGLPKCAGIAIGLDRLLMIQEKLNSISKALSFDNSKC